LTYQLSL